jgi:hypothetical protein
MPEFFGRFDQIRLPQFKHIECPIFLAENLVGQREVRDTSLQLAIGWPLKDSAGGHALLLSVDCRWRCRQTTSHRASGAVAIESVSPCKCRHPKRYGQPSSRRHRVATVTRQQQVLFRMNRPEHANIAPYAIRRIASHEK